MDNKLWKLMINNARAHIDAFDPTKPIDESDYITIWNISEVLSILTGKLKEDIVLEIANNK